MSPTSTALIPVSRIRPTLAMSRSIMFSSTGEPEPSQTRTPCLSESLPMAATASDMAAPRSMGRDSDMSMDGLPLRTIWITPLPEGFRSTGFMSVSGSRPADQAWNAWPMPISPPSLVAYEFRERFRPLKGTGSMPFLAKCLHSMAQNVVFPAPEEVPRTSIPFIPSPPGCA